MKCEVDFKLMRKAVDMRLTKSMEKAEQDHTRASRRLQYKIHSS